MLDVCTAWQQVGTKVPLQSKTESVANTAPSSATAPADLRPSLTQQARALAEKQMAANAELNANTDVMNNIRGFLNLPPLTLTRQEKLANEASALTEGQDAGDDKAHDPGAVLAPGMAVKDKHRTQTGLAKEPSNGSRTFIVTKEKKDSGFGIVFGGAIDVVQAVQYGNGVFVAEVSGIALTALEDTTTQHHMDGTDYGSNSKGLTKGVQVISINGMNTEFANLTEMQVILEVLQDQIRLEVVNNELLYVSFTAPVDSETAAWNISEYNARQRGDADAIARSKIIPDASIRGMTVRRRRPASSDPSGCTLAASGHKPTILHHHFPPGPTLAVKCLAIKEALGLDASLHVKGLIDEAHHQLGCTSAGSMMSQINSLVDYLGLDPKDPNDPLPPPTASPETEPVLDDLERKSGHNFDGALAQLSRGWEPETRDAVAYVQAVCTDEEVLLEEIEKRTEGYLAGLEQDLINAKKQISAGLNNIMCALESRTEELHAHAERINARHRTILLEQQRALQAAKQKRYDVKQGMATCVATLTDEETRTFANNVIGKLQKDSPLTTELISVPVATVIRCKFEEEQSLLLEELVFQHGFIPLERPHIVAYSNPTPTCMAGKPMPPLVPKVTGAVVQWGLKTSLGGINICNSGIVSGTPTLPAKKLAELKLSRKADVGEYSCLILAANHIDISTYKISFTIETLEPPCILGYTYNRVEYWHGSGVIAPNEPVCTGKETTFAFEGKNPCSGLDIHPDTGIISGCPSGTSDANTHAQILTWNVIATNQGGDSRFQVTYVIRQGFEVFVRMFSSKVITVHASSEIDITRLKNNIYLKVKMMSCGTLLAPNLQQLTYAGKILKDGLTLQDYAIHAHSTINCALLTGQMAEEDTVANPPSLQYIVPLPGVVQILGVGMEEYFHAKNMVERLLPRKDGRIRCRILEVRPNAQWCV